MEIEIECPYCGAMNENPSFESECTTEASCNECGERYAVSGECEWRYLIEKR